jgi:GGDEF domain-containing protein
VGSHERIVLSSNWFRFILRWALRHALRQSHYLTLVTIQASREYLGLIVEVGSQALTELATAIGPTIRETDLIGEITDGQLGLLFTHVDATDASRIIDRFAEVLGHVHFSASSGFSIGAASCPADGVDMHRLVEHAMSHLVLNVRAHPDWRVSELAT